MRTDHALRHFGVVWLAVLTMAGAAVSANEGGKSPLVIAEQGSFFVGGTSVTAPGTFDPTRFYPILDDGQSFRIDHLYAQYQIPPDVRNLPLVLVHGGGQTGKTWESTPDGRDGYQSIFVRRGFGVYIVDFPRRGKAGVPSFNGPLGSLAGTPLIPDFTTRLGDELAFMSFRLGEQSPAFYPNTQFPQAGLDQFLRQIVPFVVDDPEAVPDSLAALLEKTGPAVLVTHSQAGLYGWLTAIKSPNVKAIVAYEPVQFVFSEDAVPPPLPLYDGSVFPLHVPVPAAAFARLTQVPMQIVYGDNIPVEPTPFLSLDIWRVATDSAGKFARAVNGAGGDSALVALPDIGIFGNTHFPFSDLNNVEVADVLSRFLREKGLDRRGYERP